MRTLYRFKWEFGRMGTIEGLFISTPEVIEANLNAQVSLGEVLGKHSEVYGVLEMSDLEVVSTDQILIDRLAKACASDSICGYNPLDYIQPGEDEDDD